MSQLSAILRPSLMFLFGAAVWLAGEQIASAQVLLAQSGTAKTLVGYVLVFLALLLALLVVCRPSGRKLAEGDQKKK